jgi:hypothetical protein
MTDATPPPPDPAHRKDPSGLGPWAVALVLGLLVAVLGVNTAIGAVQRKQYFQAHQTAVFFLRNGNQINTSTQRLQEVNVRDYDLVKAAQAALVDGNTPLFSRLVAQADVFSGEQESLQDEVQQYKAGFDTALKALP